MSSEDLARRAVACKAWRWMPGMLTVGGIRVDATRGGRPARISHEWYAGERVEVEGFGLRGTDVPDFDDPATLGCLAEMVVEAFERCDDMWGLPILKRRWKNGEPMEWLVVDDGGTRALGRGPTKGEALVVALESAR